MRNISKKIHVINTTNIFIIFKSLNFSPLNIVMVFNIVMLFRSHE